MLMEHCPLFDMVGFRDGVCFLPKDGPYPKGLLLFWAPGESIFILFIYLFFFFWGGGGGVDIIILLHHCAVYHVERVVKDGHC